jgi:acyl-homoserine lactone acylase PvdQ
LFEVQHQAISSRFWLFFFSFLKYSRDHLLWLWASGYGLMVIYNQLQTLRNRENNNEQLPAQANRLKTEKAESLTHKLCQQETLAPSGSATGARRNHITLFTALAQRFAASLM